MRLLLGRGLAMRAGVDARFDGKAHAQRGGLLVRPVDGDLDRHALDDLREIAGGVVGAIGAKLTPVAGARLATWPAMLTPGRLSTRMRTRSPGCIAPIWFSWKFAITYASASGTIASRRAGRDEGADPCGAAAHLAVDGRADFRVGQVQLRLVERGLGAGQCAVCLVAPGGAARQGSG